MSRVKPISIAGIVLAVIGVGLLATSYCGWLTPVSPTSSPAAPLLPSPTWQQLPTREAAPQHGVTSDPLLLLQVAILQRDLVRGEAIWMLLMKDFSNLTPELLSAGARLALLSGDLAEAETRAWQALWAAPKDGYIWALTGVILQQAGRADQAVYAYDTAMSLDPELGPLLFHNRWQAAMATGNTLELVELADLYALLYPDSRLSAYYRAEALTASQAPLAAVGLLVEALTDSEESQAMLWYALGKAYLAYGSSAEAATCLETALLRWSNSDPTLDWILESPLTSVNRLLAQSYLGTNRCAEAQTIFRRLEATDPSLAIWTERAIICQTPTPTLTPWIPQQIGTPTPSP